MQNSKEEALRRMKSISGHVKGIERIGAVVGSDDDRDVHQLQEPGLDIFYQSKQLTNDLTQLGAGQFSDEFGTTHSPIKIFHMIGENHAGDFEAGRKQYLEWVSFRFARDRT